MTIFLRMWRIKSRVPNILVPDNLKAAVTSHKRGVVKLNKSYEDMARLDGSYTKTITKITKFKLLLLDDFAVTPLKPDEINDLFEVIEERTLNGSILITAQLPIKEWHTYLGNEIIPDLRPKRA